MQTAIFDQDVGGVSNRVGQANKRGETFVIDSQASLQNKSVKAKTNRKGSEATF